MIGCVLAVVLGPAGRALAAPASTAQAFTCLGKVAATDLQAHALIVRVAHGSSGLRAVAGVDATVFVPTQANIYATHGRGVGAATIGQITAGDRMRIAGRADLTNADVPALVAGSSSCGTSRQSDSSAGSPGSTPPWARSPSR